MLLGEIDERIDHPELRAYDVHVKGGERIMERAIRRIRRASLKYGLGPNQWKPLAGAFIASAMYRSPR